MFVACCYEGRNLKKVFGFRHDELMVAASVVKLAWVLATVRSHRAGRLDLLALMIRGELGESTYRDVLACLPAEGWRSWIEFLALALVTSANPAFDRLPRTPGLASEVKRLDLDVVVPSIIDEYPTR